MTNIQYSAFITKSNRIKNQLISKVSINAANSSFEVDAIWDTGASGTCISDEVALKLNLPVTGMCEIKTPSGTMEVPMYLVDIHLPNNVIMKDVTVMGSKIGEQGLGALIGMDIISRGDFAVSNFNGKTVFSFVAPSMQVIDFVPKSNTYNKISLSHMQKNKKK